MLPGAVDLAQVETNMIFIDTESAGLPMLETVERLASRGVAVTHTGTNVRMVTHLDVDDEGVTFALDAWRAIAADEELMGLFTKKLPA